MKEGNNSMASSAPLRGSELIDCARANRSKGIEVAATRCGYDDLAVFERELHLAGAGIGVEINSFEDLNHPDSTRNQDNGVTVEPDTPSQL